MKKQKKGYNFHHLRPRSQGGQSLDSNMCFIKKKKHEALHRMFGNFTPKQIDSMLRNFEKDFKLVFGNVTYNEAAEIYKRLLEMKQWTL
jgi:hypothetical protein